jgi:hypothetical protein
MVKILADLQNDILNRAIGESAGVVMKTVHRSLLGALEGALGINLCARPNQVRRAVVDGVVFQQSHSSAITSLQTHSLPFSFARRWRPF